MAFSGMEWIIVLVVVIVIFFAGAKKIPQLAQSFGRARGEFERGKLDVERELAAERAQAAGHPHCEKCGNLLGEKDVACLKCGSVRDRPTVVPGIGQGAR